MLLTGLGFTSMRFFLQGRGDGEDSGEEQREAVLSTEERPTGGESSVRGGWE